MALLDAGVEIANCNIMRYTSVLPPEAREIGMDEARARGLFHHGMVLESIMAQANGRTGERITAGVGTFSVHRDGQHVGGFAAEYEGDESEATAHVILLRMMDGEFERRYGNDPGCSMEAVTVTTRGMTVAEDAGTVIVALGFLTFITPGGDAE